MTQGGPGLPTVFCASDRQRAADGHALIMTNARYDPGHIRVAMIYYDGEPEFNRSIRIRPVGPLATGIDTLKNAAVVLLREDIRLSGT